MVHEDLNLTKITTDLGIFKSLAEFATIAVAHNIRKMISNGYDAVVERR